MRMRVALATGSATPLGPPPVREVATVSDTMSCPDPSLNPLPGAGLVPEDFEVVAVLECANGVTREDADGVLAGNEVLRYEGDLTEFLDAMAAPSDPGPAAVCPAVGYAFRAIWATDAAGRFVPMSFPLTACGGPKEDEPLAALARLEVVDRTSSGAGRVELHEATAVGCATRAGAHCSETASRFVVVHPDVTASAGGAPLTVTVELDGCQRIVGSDFQTRSAFPALIPLLSP